MPDSYEFSAGIGTDVKAREAKLSSPPFLSFVVATYFLSNLIFLLTFLVNFPVVRDAIPWNNVEKLFLAVRDNYVFAMIAAAAVSLIDAVVIYSNYVKRKFPSMLSFSTIIYNDIMCILFAAIVYINDVRNIYFSMQITLLIPIITILLSSVFIIDDYHDLRAGRYSPPSAKPKKGELQIADVPAMNRTSSAEIAAANAAKLAIPVLSAKEPEPTDDSKENAGEGTKDVESVEEAPKIEPDKNATTEV